MNRMGLLDPTRTNNNNRIQPGEAHLNHLLEVLCRKSLRPMVCTFYIGVGIKGGNIGGIHGRPLAQVMSDPM